MAAAAQEMEDKVRGLEDIPSPPLVPVLKHLPLILNKKNAYDMTTFAAGLREKFGDIVRLQIPGMGNGNMIMLFKAKAGLNNLHKNEMIILVFKKALGAKKIADRIQFLISSRFSSNYSAWA